MKRKGRKKINNGLNLKRDLALLAVMFFVLVIVYGVTYSLTGGSSTLSEGVTKNAEVKVTSIVSSEVDYIDKGMIGTDVNLYYEIYPSNASLSAVKMESSDESIVAINSDGTIRPISIGQAYVTITSLSNTSIKTTVLVVVE